VYCRVFGKSQEELIGRHWQPVAHSDDLPMIEARLAELSPQQPVAVIENRVYAAGGELRWMQFVNRALFDPAGRITEIQVVGRDISGRKAIEARQAALLDENTRLGQALIVLQEKERADLARELHDELSQDLVAIRAHAGAIRRRAAGTDARIESDAGAIEASARRIYDASHRLMEGLRPQVLDSAGLAEAVQALLAGWSETHPGTQLRLRLAGNLGTIDADTRIQLFRITQEALTNISGHARAKRVRLFLGAAMRRGQRRLRLVIRDDGVGMDPLAAHPGYGLIAMRERARSLGGNLDLRARPGGGTRLAVEVPLAD
jgi:PAS domain S-box-containing protein